MYRRFQNRRTVRAEFACKIQTMYVTNLRSGLEYIVKEQNDLAKDYYKKIAQPVRV